MYTNDRRASSGPSAAAPSRVLAIGVQIRLSVRRSPMERGARGVGLESAVFMGEKTPVDEVALLIIRDASRVPA